MFDRLLLMAEGRVAFLGDTKNAATFFQDIGHPCPYNFNPADHYIHVLAVTPGQETESKQTIDAICDEFENNAFGTEVKENLQYQIEHQSSNGLFDVKDKKSPYKASWFEQFRALLWRSFLSVIKEPLIMQVRIGQTIVSMYRCHLDFHPPGPPSFLCAVSL